MDLVFPQQSFVNVVQFLSPERRPRAYLLGGRIELQVRGIVTRPPSPPHLPSLQSVMVNVQCHKLTSIHRPQSRGRATRLTSCIGDWGIGFSQNKLATGSF